MGIGEGRPPTSKDIVRLASVLVTGHKNLPATVRRLVDAYGMEEDMVDILSCSFSQCFGGEEGEALALRICLFGTCSSCGAGIAVGDGMEDNGTFTPLCRPCASQRILDKCSSER